MKTKHQNQNHLKAENLFFNYFKEMISNELMQGIWLLKEMASMLTLCIFDMHLTIIPIYKHIIEVQQLEY